MGRGGAGVVEQKVEPVEIALRKITRASRIGILDRDGNDTAFFVIDDGGTVRQMFGGIYAIPLVIDGLELKAIDQLTCNCAAAQQVNEERSAVVAAQEASGQAAEPSHAAETASGEGSQHCCTHAWIAGWHDLRGRLISLRQCEGDEEAQQQRNRRNAKEKTTALPQDAGACNPIRCGDGFNWK